MGTILHVDLTTGKIIKEPLDPQMAREYVGGRGLAVKMLFDRLPDACDPLGPENMLIFINGPLTLSGVLSSGRYMVVTKSPLTGTICSSNSGGYFPAAFKTAGYDALVLSGKSEKPVYLWINDDKVEIRDAGDLWGLDTRSTTSSVCKKPTRMLVSPASVPPEKTWSVMPRSSTMPIARRRVPVSGRSWVQKISRQ